jgi:hypothetical protein
MFSFINEFHPFLFIHVFGQANEFHPFLLICVFGANNLNFYQVIMQKYWPSIWVPILLVVLFNGGCNDILFYFIFILFVARNQFGWPTINSF